MIHDIITVFKGLKNCIEVILCELQSIQSILEITNEEFPIYESALYALQHSINNLMKIYNYKIPIQHILKFELLQNIHIKLKSFSTILDQFSDWDTRIIKHKCLNFEQFLFFLSNPSPSKILQKLEKTFICIEPLIKDLLVLEEKILGTAIRIEHPILQKAWLMVGGNQLNDTDIPSSILVENLYAMYLIEQNNYIPNKDYVIKKITDFVNTIDGIAGTDHDNKITITEINLFTTTESNSKSVKALIDISVSEKEPVELDDVKLGPIYVNIPIEFREPVNVNYMGKKIIKEPLCIGYGSDFNNINACEFMILSDLLPNNNYKLFGIDIECIANDQGFGGTNQCHLHYQINDKISVKAFHVDRNQFPDNTYKFSIPPEKILLGDVVKLWIFSPGWSGWSMTLNGVKSRAKFVPL
jgi:hypothetical protein